MFKKILIVICLLIALFIILPAACKLDNLIGDLAKDVDEMTKVFGEFWKYPLAFYLASSALLFWVGIPAGWRYARDNFWGIWGILIAAFIGMYLSLPIAIVQLFKPRYD